MKVLRQRAGEAEFDAGTWFLFGTDPDGGKLELQVRRLSAAEERRIEFRVSGKKRTQRFVRGGGREMDFDVEKSLAETLEKACEALVETRGFEVEVLDDESAGIYAKLLNVPAVPQGMLCLDGRWTPKLKAYVLDQLPEVVTFVGKKAESLKLKAVEEEEGKGST